MANPVKFAVASALLLTHVSVAAPTHDALAALTIKLEQIRVESGLPGMAVAMASHGKILYERGFGWANREDRIPAAEDTMFSLASAWGRGHLCLKYNDLWQGLALGGSVMRFAVYREQGIHR